jgi:hypothetical protein
MVPFFDFSSPEKPVNFLSFRHFVVYLFDHFEGNEIRRQGERTSKEAHYDQPDRHILEGILARLWKRPSVLDKRSRYQKLEIPPKTRCPVTRLTRS